MRITTSAPESYQTFHAHLTKLTGQEVVWHHQLHPDRYAVDCDTPESQPHDFSGKPLELLQLIRSADAVMRRFIVIRDHDYNERSTYMPVRYQQMLAAGEELYIARLGQFAQFMARCLGARHGILLDYIASTHTNIPVHGAWEIQPNPDIGSNPTAIRDIVYATPDTLREICLYEPPYTQPYDHELAGWVTASRLACMTVGTQVMAAAIAQHACPSQPDAT